MSVSGDDLRKYLIVPSSPTFSFAQSSSSPTAPPAAKPLFSDLGTGSEHRRPNAQGTSDQAEKPNMEIDTPMSPPVSGSAYAEDKVRASAVPLDDVFSMEDFMKQHGDEHQAQLLAREAKQTVPPAKKMKTNEKASPLTPVAVGTRSSRHTILLHEKYQALGIPQPQFTYEGGSSSGWTVSISFPGLDDAEELQGLAEEKKFNSKQEAKEAVSQKALAVMEEWEKEGRIKKAEKGKRMCIGGSGQVVQQQQKADKDPGENYIGQLLEFQRSTNSPQPIYTDYKSGNSFTCLLTIEGQSTPFGSLSTLSSSKKAARQEAARHAISHFKAQGVWPDDVPPIGGIKKKKKKKAQPQPTLPDDAAPDLHPSMSSPSPSSSSPSTMSYAQQVATLAVILALPTPEWKYSPNPSDPTFHHVSCFFRGAGQHEGPIGTVRNVYGKKKAKEECARLTLEYLKEVQERRLAYGRSMMEGIKGAEGVVGVAEGMRVDGDQGKGKGKAFGREMEMDEGGSEGGDAAFEDAEERL